MASLGLAALMLESAVSHALVQLPPQRGPLVWSSLATMLALLAFWAGQRRGTVPLNWAFPAVLICSAMMLGNILLMLHLLGEPNHNLYICLLLAGLGMFCPSMPWFLTGTAMALAGWGWQAWTHRHVPGWIDTAHLLADALLLSLVLQFVRRRSILKMERMRQDDLARAAQLEQAVTNLRASEDLFRQFAENCGQVLWINSLENSEVTYVNRIYEELTGRPIQNLYNNPMDWTAAIHQDDRQRIAAAYQAFRQTGKFDENYRVLRPDGSLRWVHDRAFLIGAQPGGVARIAGIVRDITEEVLTEQHLRESEQTNRAILAALPDMIMRLRGDGSVISTQVSRDFSPLWTTEGQHVRQMQPPDVADLFIAAAAQTLATQRLQTLEYEGIRDDRRQWREARFTPAGNDEVLVVIRDFTARKQAELDLTISRAKLAELIGDIDGMVWECDAETFEFSFVSTRSEAIFGYPVSRWLSDRDLFAAVLHPDDRERVLGNCRRLTLDGLDHELTYRAIAADGRTVWVHDKVHLVKNTDGKVTRLRGIMFDITALKESESQRQQLMEDLRQSQKLEAVGTLATGVAHDFNNLLTAIGCATELAMQELPPEHAARKPMNTVMQAVEQATSVTRSLLTSAQKTPYHKTVLDLNRNLHESLQVLRRLLPAKIEMVEDFPENQPVWIQADAHQLQQVWMNLAINARDAMPQGGKLTFRIRRAFEVPTDPAGSWSGRTDEMVAVQIIDEGTGMDEATLARIFEPYFTTKSRGRGTGLGLSIVRGIVAEHHGKLRVKSAPGHGTRFTIYLPTCPEPTPPASKSPVASRLETPATILLAEDNEYVLAIMASSLRAAGYDVTTAADGHEAMRIFREHSNQVHLVILDLDLPGFSGEACVGEIRQTQPDLPVLIVTGDPQLANAFENEMVIAKPFQMSRLIEAVELAIQERGPARSD